LTGIKVIHGCWERVGPRATAAIEGPTKDA
jgi:hypothetical protein